MKSVSVKGVSKVYALGSHNTNFKELITEKALSIFSSREKTENGVFYALKDISFELDIGDVLGIIGDNGAGKSTLLKIISGVSQPSQGEVRLEGKISSILEIGTGFHMELTGKENIFLSGSILGMQREEIERQYDNILRFSGLNDFINVPIKRYSSGMYLRLAFSVLAHLSAEIILLDEIIYVGDAEFRMKSYNKIKELARSGKTILVVSHDLSSISDLCTKCLLLEKGRIKVFGKTGEIVRSYLDKSMNKYIHAQAEEEQAKKTKAEMEKLQSKIEVMDKVIQEKEMALNNTSEKEQQLVSELNTLKDEARELFKVRKELEEGKHVDLDSTSFLKSEKAWDDEAAAPGNDILKIKRIACTTHDNKKTITQSDDFQIEIEYWKYTDAPLIVTLTASYNFSQIVFGTASAFGDHTLVRNEGKGLFKHVCHIPRHLLNHGVFAFSFFFMNNEGMEVFGMHHAVSLKIEYESSFFKKFEDKGVVMVPFVPVFKWS
jgi:ABC-type polysaccharide/polyol phosphate transport system ATPase subunit